jgi:2-oxoglutarate dehydrogenase E1 component
LKEGFNVRFSGQDVERGTFSHRHAVLVDQKTNEKYIPLRSLLPERDIKNFQIENSLLSEYAVLGYEYGYSITNPNTLTIWEAQFGDFANGAQIVIDNYLSSGESKWGVESGLVMNLPHGMDGQGPEHSSARMERFLQLMSEDLASVVQGRKSRIKRQILNSNMQIINCSCAANYFHALRRQLRRQFRKPLINLFSKKLLKFKPAMSTYDMFAAGNRFFTVMPETESEQLVPPAEISKVIIVSGQAYYSLVEKRAELKQRVIL